MCEHSHSSIAFTSMVDCSGRTTSRELTIEFLIADSCNDVMWSIAGMLDATVTY
jgi:hypothetical protein